MLYFAYGSNMSTRRLQARVPSASAIATGYVTGHQLAWDKRSISGGKCDLEATGKPGDRVWGVLFEIAEGELPALDAAEGYPDHYQRKTIAVIGGDAEHQALTYYALIKQPGLKAYAWYRHHVLHGAQEHGLPADYIAQIEAVKALPDPQPERTIKELAIYD